MSHVLAKIRDVDIDTIKEQLEADAAAHARRGLTLKHVWQNANDPREVQFLFESDDLASARKFIEETRADARRKDPNSVLPEMTYLEGGSEDDDAIELELELSGEDDAEEKDLADAEPQTETPNSTPQLPLNGIALAVASALVGAALGAGGASITLSCPVPTPAQQLPMQKPVSVTSEPVKASSSNAPSPRSLEGAASAAPVEGTPIIDETVFGTGDDATDAGVSTDGTTMEDGTIPATR